MVPKFSLSTAPLCFSAKTGLCRAGKIAAVRSTELLPNAKTVQLPRQGVPVPAFISSYLTWPGSRIGDPTWSTDVQGVPHETYIFVASVHGVRLTVVYK